MVGRASSSVVRERRMSGEPDRKGLESPGGSGVLGAGGGVRPEGAGWGGEGGGPRTTRLAPSRNLVRWATADRGAAAVPIEVASAAGDGMPHSVCGQSSARSASGAGSQPEDKPRSVSRTSAPHISWLTQARGARARRISEAMSARTQSMRPRPTVDHASGFPRCSRTILIRGHDGGRSRLIARVAVRPGSTRV